MIARPFALALLALAGAAAAKPRTAPVATPDGPTQTCIPIGQIRESRVQDDRTIDFFIGRRVYRNVLPQSCPMLDSERAFGYATSLSELCSTDIIHVIRQGLLGIPGPSCGLGTFQPVKGIR